MKAKISHFAADAIAWPVAVCPRVQLTRTARDVDVKFSDDHAKLSMAELEPLISLLLTLFMSQKKGVQSW
jgi:hypothetical protein